MKFILRSPFHGLISTNIMLIAFTGRRSGETYSTPVNYVRGDDGITVFSRRSRTWWKNLRGGAPVTVRVKGQELKAIAESTEDLDRVTAALLDYLGQSPNYAKYYQVTLGPTGAPNPEEVAQAARDLVLIRIRPNQ